MNEEDRFNPAICIADDEEGIRFGLSRLFSRAGYEVRACATGEAVLEEVRNQHIDILLLDVRLAGAMDGHEVLRRLQGIDPDLPVLVITGYGTIESAVEAMKRGAEDYILKPVDNASLLNKVSSRLEGNRTTGNPGSSSPAASEDASLVAESPGMRRLLDFAARIQDQDISVLLTGESGVGKEMLARHIHQESRRREGPFIGVNCAAFSETLLLSELFGHEKGAFTGADRRKPGCFERANGGTLFLDEIGDMAPDAQSKLLRVLENHRFERLGGSEPVSVDVRIIAATNQNVEELVRAGSFREDLYYRINVVRMAIPPLRERPEDLRRLIEDFLQLFNKKYGRRLNGIPQDVMSRLLSYNWPGNGRELKNVMSQSVLLSDGEALELFGLPPGAGENATPPSSGGRSTYHSTVSAAREGEGRQLVVSALRKSGGNK